MRVRICLSLLVGMLVLLGGCKLVKVGEDEIKQYAIRAIPEGVIIAPATVTFVLIPTPDDKVRWDFGDGATLETQEQVVMHTFVSPGRYIVQAKVGKSVAWRAVKVVAKSDGFGTVKENGLIRVTMLAPATAKAGERVLVWVMVESLQKLQYLDYGYIGDLFCVEGCEYFTGGGVAPVVEFTITLRAMDGTGTQKVELQFWASDGDKNTSELRISQMVEVIP